MIVASELFLRLRKLIFSDSLNFRRNLRYLKMRKEEIIVVQRAARYAKAEVAKGHAAPQVYEGLVNMLEAIPDLPPLRVDDLSYLIGELDNEKKKKGFSEFFRKHLSSRIIRVFESEGVITLGDLAKYRDREIRKIEGLGKRTLGKIKRVLGEYAKRI